MKKYLRNLGGIGMLPDPPVTTPPVPPLTGDDEDSEAGE